MRKKLGLFLLLYLKFFAKLQLLKNKHAIVIGITGSAGKTSTRKALALILKEKGIVKESIKANSESGIPLNILNIKIDNFTLLSWIKVAVLAPLKVLINWEHYDYYVVEMGIDSPEEPKNMSYLLKIIRPDVGVVLNAGLVHGMSFDHLVVDRNPKRREIKIKQEIAKEKMKIAYGLKPTGFAVVNIDQKELLGNSQGIKARLMTFGKNKTARLRFIKYSLSKSGFKLDFKYQNRDYQLQLPDLYEEGYVNTFCAAIAVAAGLGIPIETSLKALANYRAPAGRLRIFKGINNFTLIDSSYNASPSTVESALLLLSQISGKAHKVAILGDMRELGKESKSSHKKLADLIMKYADEALLFGQDIGAYTFPVLQSSSYHAHHYDKVADLIRAARELPINSYVLIKGSQNTILLERVVEALLLDKNDVSKLCRRGAYWDRIRAKTP